MMAQQEELGDLKLYRIPEPVTVAAKSQKQVAFLDRDGVKVDTIYRQRLYAGAPSQQPVTRVLTTRNRKQEGLGLPLPAGGVVVFAKGQERPVLIGRGSMNDNAIGEDVEIEVGATSAVTTRLNSSGPLLQGPIRAVPAVAADWQLIVSNARPEPVRFEAEFEIGSGRFEPSGTLPRRNGRPLWAVTVPANGEAILRYKFSAE